MFRRLLRQVNAELYDLPRWRLLPIPAAWLLRENGPYGNELLNNGDVLICRRKWVADTRVPWLRQKSTIQSQSNQQTGKIEDVL
jgi:hypothetical protein